MGIAQAAANTGASVGVITGSLLLGAFILKVIDLLKYVIKWDLNGIVTLGLTWIVGFVAVQVFIETQWGDEVKIGDETLDQLNTVSKIVFGLVAPAVAALLYDAKKAVDNDDSAKSPRLMPDRQKPRS